MASSPEAVRVVQHGKATSSSLQCCRRGELRGETTAVQGACLSKSRSKICQGAPSGGTLNSLAPRVVVASRVSLSSPTRPLAGPGRLRKLGIERANGHADESLSCFKFGGQRQIGGQLPRQWQVRQLQTSAGEPTLYTDTSLKDPCMHPLLQRLRGLPPSLTTLFCCTPADFLPCWPPGVACCCGPVAQRFDLCSLSRPEPRGDMQRRS